MQRCAVVIIPEIFVNKILDLHVYYIHCRSKVFLHISVSFFLYEFMKIYQRDIY